MCLGVVFLLLCQFGLINFGFDDFKQSFVSKHFILIFRYLIVLAFSFTVITLFKKFLFDNRIQSRQNKSLKALKFRFRNFEAILSKQKSFSANIGDVGFQFGNPDGKYKLLIVSNPYCTPCGDAHRDVMQLIKLNEDLSVRLIFSTKDSNDIRAKVVNQFFIISQEYKREEFKNALESWFLDSKRDFDKFLQKYPSEYNDSNFDRELSDMRDFCFSVGIEYTPTVYVSTSKFINEKEVYYELPESYRIIDLKYLLI